jgi:hypothetical protein
MSKAGLDNRHRNHDGETSHKHPICPYGLVRSGSVFPNYVGLLTSLPRAFSWLVRPYTHPSGGNCGGKNPYFD